MTPATVETLFATALEIIERAARAATAGAVPDPHELADAAASIRAAIRIVRLSK